MVRKLQNLLLNKIMAPVPDSDSCCFGYRQTPAAAGNSDLLFPKAETGI